jgi:hypothetical protein
MIRADMIPDEVVWKLHDKLWKVGGPNVDEVRASIAAALQAWPGMHTGWQCIGCGDDAQIILPLPQEEKGGQ